MDVYLFENGLEILNTDECWRILRKAIIGRVGLVVDGTPAVLPVNFAVDDEFVVFHTGTGAKLDAARGGQTLAFEVDGWDELNHAGWSVMGTGAAEEVTDPGELERVDRLPVRPWAMGSRDHVVRIAIDTLTGRAFRLPGADHPLRVPQQQARER